MVVFPPPGGPPMRTTVVTCAPVPVGSAGYGVHGHALPADPTGVQWISTSSYWRASWPPNPSTGTCHRGRRWFVSLSRSGRRHHEDGSMSCPWCSGIQTCIPISLGCEATGCGWWGRYIDGSGPIRSGDEVVWNWSHRKCGAALNRPRRSGTAPPSIHGCREPLSLLLRPTPRKPVAPSPMPAETPSMRRSLRSSHR